MKHSFRYFHPKHSWTPCFLLYLYPEYNYVTVSHIIDRVYNLSTHMMKPSEYVKCFPAWKEKVNYTICFQPTSTLGVVKYTQATFGNIMCKYFTNHYPYKAKTCSLLLTAEKLGTLVNQKLKKKGSLKLGENFGILLYYVVT